MRGRPVDCAVLSELPSLIHRIPAAAYVCDADGLITDFNQHAVALWGREPKRNDPADRFCGSFRLFSPDGRPIVHDECWMALAIREGVEYQGQEIVIERLDGSRVHALAHASPLRDDEGTICGGLNVLVDITDRKRAEETSALLAAIVTSSDDAIVSKSLDGRILSWNAGAERLFGYSAEEAVGRSITLIVPPDLLDEEASILARVRRGERIEHYETSRVTKDGRRVEVSLTISPVRDGKGRIFGASKVARDVTEQKRTERLLREQKEQVAALLETLPVAVFIAHDAECRQISGNRAAAELLRMPPLANFSLTAPEGERPTQFRVLRSGQEVAPEDLPMQRAARGEVVVGEEVDHVFDDGAVCHSVVSAKPLYGPDGRPRGAVAAVQDITTLRNIEGKLREADRRKDEFLALLAHELRNPLVPLRSGLDLLALDNASPDVVALMCRQVEQMVRLVDDLLDVSRITRGRVELRKTQVELAELASRAVETARPLFDARQHQFTCILPAGPVWLEADAVRLAQALANLLVNAAKYTEPGGRIQFAARLEGGEVVLSVRDNGIGIEPAMMARIFDLFAQEARALGRAQGGLGIGLTLAKRLVEMHGGRLSVRSDGPGAGSEFTVRLPVASQGGESSAPRRPSPAAVGRRILVVDDNEASTTILTRLLAKTGDHEVRAAHDGSSALEMAADFRPELAILDIGLPQIDGYEVARQLRRQFGQDLLLVALTGYGAPDDLRRSRAAGFDEHLVKPPGFETLRGLFDHAKLASSP